MVCKDNGRVNGVETELGSGSLHYGKDLKSLRSKPSTHLQRLTWMQTDHGLRGTLPPEKRLIDAHMDYNSCHL